MRFQVPTAVSRRYTWSFVEIYRCFRAGCCFHRQGISVKSSRQFFRDHPAQCPKRHLHNGRCGNQKCQILQLFYTRLLLWSVCFTMKRVFWRGSWLYFVWKCKHFKLLMHSFTFITFSIIFVNRNTFSYFS